MSTSDVRIGVLIDADNTSGVHAKAILDELAKYGVVTVKRAYGDWSTPQLSSWREALLDHAIQPNHTVAYTKGKNSTDSALIIDAMDLLYAGNLEAFALVSSDSDFTRLASRLRESGKTVYGIGARKTPKSLINACNQFIFLDLIAGGTAPDPDEDAAPLPELRPMLLRAVDDAADQGTGWANLSAVGNALQKRHASFDSRDYEFPKLVSLVRAQSYLEVEQNGNTTRVRLKPVAAKKQPAKKSAAKKSATR